uniref:WD repeat-containing protein 19 n=1 Tax=Trypanosoma vivax (strain Y486) TaxID=1055687 RepID=G0U9P9_TRYVY|nr:conserved hypothetical protein [Trypanosoma vivax Y486]
MWDTARGVLALIQRESSNITFFTSDKAETEAIDCGLQGLCFLAWSSDSSMLAVGALKGGLVLINSDTMKKVPVVGAHTDAIVSGKWTKTNHLVVIGEDRVLSVIGSSGAVCKQLQVGNAPRLLWLVEPPSRDKEPSLARAGAIVSVGSGLLHYNLESGRRMEVPLDSKYGQVTALAGLPDGVMCVGLSSGAMALIRGTAEETKVYGVTRPFKEDVHDLSCCVGTSVCAALSANQLRFFSLLGRRITEIKTDTIEFDKAIGVPRRVRWSKNGANVTVVTNHAQLINYSLNSTIMSVVYGSVVCSLTGPRTVKAKNLTDGRILYTAEVEFDPTLIAACREVLAVCGRSNVVYHSIEDNIAKPVNTMEYPSAVTAIKVSSKHAAVMYGGKVQLHEVTPGGNSVTLPENGVANIISMGISESLFMYATEEKIFIISLADYQCVVEHAPTGGITRAVANPSCTRVAIIDKSDAMFVFNPVTLVSTQTEGFEKEHKDIMWDSMDFGVLISYNIKSIVTYVYAWHSRYGPTSESIVVKGSKSENLITPMPGGFGTPLCLIKGVLTLQSSSGALESLTLQSHKNTTTRSPDPEAFHNNFSLNHLRWASQNISTTQEAEDLAVKALHMLDIELAIRLYRQLSQPSLVMYIESIKHINEKNLLIGHISMIMGYFKDAQNFFLRSSQPLCALQMRHDLMQWEPALSLAKQFAPEKLPILSKEYAQQLEYRGDYAKALEMYRAGEMSMPKGHASTELTVAQEEVKNHNAICVQGVARCLLRTGSVSDGVKLARESNDLTLMTECAEILESIKQYDEAAHLYEKALNFEHAAKLYIVDAKNLKAAARVIPKITSRNIIGMFAVGKEDEDAFQEAEKAYAQAEDWDNVVRIKVERLNDLHGAYKIVRETRSAAAASIVATMCKNRGEFASAVEFFVMAKSFQEAFELAKDRGCMSNLESSLLSQIQLVDGVAPPSSQGEFAVIAQHYEHINKPGQAGLFYHIAGNFPLALKNYLEAGEPEDIEKAIQVVGKSRSDALTNKLIDYLMGEADGEPKEPSYIFKVYMALGSYEKAAKTSVLIATKEQEVGGYITAHKTLVEACCILREKSIRVPNDLRRALLLLHSYIIVKHLIKTMGDNETASRMLLRVVKNVQRFPQHIATIYTSTALQCLKSGFKKSAFENACVIIQSEKYRTELDDKNRKKIESIVRRRGKEELEDPLEKTSPCPFCGAQVLETELDCGSCKNTLPYCIVTGKHIVKENYSECPSCHFPAIYSAFMTLLRNSQVCPMCETVVDLNKVQKQTDPDLGRFLS